MDYGFCHIDRHRVCEANYNHYEIPALHPDRVMDVHDFVYILQGQWKICQENETFDLGKDDVLILPAGFHHYGLEPCLSGTKTMYLHVELGQGDGQMGECLRLGSHLAASGRPEVRRLFERIILAKAEGDALRASIYFDALLCELEALSAGGGNRDLAGDLRNAILAASDRIPKNSELARAFHVSVKTAENTFRNAYGMTIHQYVLQTKIRQVQDYLQNFPDMKLHQIARNLGFYDEYHLSRQFKRLCGTSPSQYRQNISDKEEAK